MCVSPLPPPLAAIQRLSSMQGAVTSDTAQATPETAAVATTSADAAMPKALRELCIDNSAVTVWRTIIEPNNELKMHRHDRARIVVGLKGGSLRKVTDSGEESPLVFEAGKAYWLEADPPFELHRYAFRQGPGLGPDILGPVTSSKQLGIACAALRLVSITAHF